MLSKGDAAPAFDSIDQDGTTSKLSDYAGRKLVLYFYPKDDTPGCTIEANGFTALAAEFDAVDTSIIGVSKDDCASHRAFIDKFGLKIALLADTSGDVCDAYGVWQEKERDGVKRMGIVRSTFIIDRQGRIDEAIYQVDPNGHAEAMLEKVKQLP